MSKRLKPPTGEMDEPPLKKVCNRDLEESESTDESGLVSGSSSGEGSGEEETSIEESYIYDGEYDQNGKYTGEGVLEMKHAGTKYTGSFVDGEMTGKGQLVFPDGSTLTGSFKNGGLFGPGVFVSDEGTKMEGTFDDNLMVGKGKEFYPDGELFFEGEYKDGVREGKGVMYYTDERAKIEGTWVDGVLQGEATYYYPDGSTLSGRWRNGAMRAAKFTSVIDPSFNTDVKYSYDESTLKRIAKYPLRRDPYESQYSYAKKSEILPKAGEGLFALRDIPADFIVCLYNGIRITLEDGEKKDWELKPNLICLNDGMCVDVPVELSDMKVFQNTIGHKANHHWDNNAEYALYWGHPIFGKIRCIRTLRPVKKDEEIFVNYSYEEEGPEWYLDFMKGRLQKDKIAATQQADQKEDVMNVDKKL